MFQYYINTQIHSSPCLQSVSSGTESVCNELFFNANLRHYHRFVDFSLVNFSVVNQNLCAGYWHLGYPMFSKAESLITSAEWKAARYYSPLTAYSPTPSETNIVAGYRESRSCLRQTLYLRQHSCLGRLGTDIIYHSVDTEARKSSSDI
jgi:hypothetical protein